MKFPVLACVVLFSLASVEAGEKKDPSILTVERIFGGGEFSSEGFSARWLAGGEGGAAYTRLEASRDPAGGQDIVRYDAETGSREVLVSSALLVPPGSSSPLKIEGYSWSRGRSLVLIFTNSRRVWRRRTRGDYWVLDRTSRELRKLGGDAKPATLMFAKLSPAGSHAAYVRENDIYVEDLQSHAITPLTTSGSKDIINGTFDWVYEEELSLRDGFRWSPDGKRIAYWQIDTRGVREFCLVNNTAGLYPRITRFKYPKAGERNPACRIGVVDIGGGKTRWLDVPGDRRNHYVARMDWAPGPGAPDEIVLEQLNRLQNTNRLMLASARTAKVRTILTERDDAWVDVNDGLHWLSGGKRFTWVSERDGWRHVYVVSRSGEETRLLTRGEYDVIGVAGVDEAGGWLYFTASPESPAQAYLYRVSLDGGAPERLTPAERPGTHNYKISSRGQWAVHTYSTFETPPVTDLVRLPGHETVRTLAANKRLRQRLEKLKRLPPEFFRVDIGDGVLLDAWCLKPPGFDAASKYPLLIYVYGEPAGSTVRDRWGGGNYLWHLMLAQRGYIVMSFDNRGTAAPRGRAWRKVIYRKIGILAPRDQAAALEAVLAKRPYIDPDRVGIWGWSGGGSMSLHAIFRYPDLYKTAVSVAPVCNERYYDTIYQERYMGLPRDNAEGYVEGSPITHARNLRGNLLIIHGTGDDNCHYQGTEALINELIRCNKPFTMMAYPNRTHSISEGRNTSRHLRELMTRYIESHLPAK